LEHDYGYRRIHGVDRERDRQLSEYRAHLRSTNVPEDLVGGRACQSENPGSPVSKGRRGIRHGCSAGGPTSIDAQVRQRYPHVPADASSIWNPLKRWPSSRRGYNPNTGLTFGRRLIAELATPERTERAVI
jgi:hypothetical protein